MSIPKQYVLRHIYMGEFSCENRHFVFFFLKSRIGHLHGARFTQDLVRAVSPDMPQKSQIAAVTHTGKILRRWLHTIATRRCHLHIKTASQ